MIRAAGLRVRGGTVTAGGAVPSAGELERHLGDGVIEKIVSAALEGAS